MIQNFDYLLLVPYCIGFLCSLIVTLVGPRFTPHLARILRLIASHLDPVPIEPHSPI